MGQGLQPEGFAEIMELAPRLKALRADIAKHTHREPAGVTLPRHLEPESNQGAGSTDSPAMLIGLPITWGDQAALIYKA